MKRTRRQATVAVLGIGVMLLGSGVAAATEQPDAQRRIADLEARIAQLEKEQGANWITEARAAEIRSLVQDVLADADTRSSMLAGASGGWDNGFFLASGDGNFRLNVNGQMQFRYVFNHQDDGPGIDTTRSGFENRRTKLIFSGHVVDPSWIYRVEGNFGFSGGTFGLQDAYFGKVLGNGWAVLAGQFKVPMLRETLVDASMQQFVERSLVEAEFGAGRTQGVAVWYRNDWLDFWAGYTDGHPATGGFNAPALALDTEYSLTARASVLFSGTWEQFNDLPSFPGDDFGFMLGAAVHYQDGEYGTPVGEAEVLQWTVDASAEFGGANIFGFVVGRHIDFGSGASLDQYGAVIQAGFFVADEWELFARYEWGDDDFSSSDLNALTLGLTRYFSQHQLKWTTDVGVGFDAVTATFGSGFLGAGGGQAGWRTDASGNDTQVVVRSQFQLLF